MATPSATPTPEEVEDLLLSCRYGELDDVRAFHQNYGADAVASARDDNANTVLHMAAANGHADVLAFLLPILPSTLLPVANNAGSTAAHWAALNKHLPALKALIEHPSPDGEGGAKLVELRNAVGRSVLGEAEMAEWDEGAAWLVGVMELRVGGAGSEGSSAEATSGGGMKEGETNEEVEDVDVGGDSQTDPKGTSARLRDVDIEIRDAEGRVAGMTLSSGP